MNITIAHTNAIKNFSAEWDAILPLHHHLNAKHLQAFELSRVEDVQPHYVKVFFDNEYVGIIYLQLFNLNRKHINFNNSSSFITKCVQAILPKNLTILICGHLFRIHFKGYYFKNEAYNTHIFTCINIFANQYNKPSGILVKDANHKFDEKIYKHKGYRFFDADATMDVYRRQTWLTFENYLADLNKKYLQRAKKIIKSFDGINVIELTAEEILQNSSNITLLYNNVVNKQTIKLGYVNAAYFYNLKNSLGNNFELLGIYKNEIMIGFYTFIFYDTEMETHFIGLNYEENKTHNLYFNILFLGIKKMIEKGYNSLEFGRTAKDAKINVGATQSQIINYIKVKNYFGKVILNCILSMFKKTEINIDAIRHPLKIEK